MGGFRAFSQRADEITANAAATANRPGIGSLIRSQFAIFNKVFQLSLGSLELLLINRRPGRLNFLIDPLAKRIVTGRFTIGECNPEAENVNQVSLTKYIH